MPPRSYLAFFNRFRSQQPEHAEHNPQQDERPTANPSGDGPLQRTLQQDPRSVYKKADHDAVASSSKNSSESLGSTIGMGYQKKAALQLQRKLQYSHIEHPPGSLNFYIPEDRKRAIIIFEVILGQIRCVQPGRATELSNTAYGRAKNLFTILAYMGKAYEICEFLSEEVFDDDLPFDRDATDNLIRRNGQKIECTSHWELDKTHGFARKQWCVLAPVFSISEHYEFHNNTILPFNHDEESSAGGAYSEVALAQIHPAHYNWPDLSGSPVRFWTLQLAKSNMLTNFEGKGFGVAIKKLHSHEAEEFKKEQTILKQLGRKKHGHLVKLLVSYEYRGNYHLVFPLAEGNLRDFWEKHPDPKFKKEAVLWSLKQMKGIAHAIYTIHNFRITLPNSAEGEIVTSQGNTKVSFRPGEEQYGRHGDLKPENILWFRQTLQDQDSYGTCQITDLGLGRFHGRDTITKQAPYTIFSSPTYEPPECHMNFPISRAYDLWSLGCLFLEFVSWLLMGCQAIEEFSRTRLENSCILNEQSKIQDNYFWTLLRVGNSKDAKIREGVEIWVSKLREYSRCSNLIQDILSLIMADLLCIHPEERIDARVLHMRFGAMLERAQKDEEYLGVPGQDRDSAGKKVTFALDPADGFDSSDIASSDSRPPESSSIASSSDDVFSRNSKPTASSFTDTDTGIANKEKGIQGISYAKSNYSWRTEHASAQSSINWFAKVVLQHLKSEMHEDSSLDAVLLFLEEALRGFSDKFAHEVQSQKARNETVRIRRYRTRIKKSFEDAYRECFQQDYKEESKVEEEEEEEQKRPNVGCMPFSEKMGMFFGSDPSGTDGQTFESADRVDPPASDGMATSEGSTDRSDLNEPEFQLFRDEPQTLTASLAFRWLLSRLLRGIYLQTPTPNIMAMIQEKIRQAIVEKIPSVMSVSRERPVSTYRATFTVDWDPLAFVELQGYREEPSHVVAAAVTLTGSAECAQALTCAQYMDQTWPVTGYRILNLLKALLASKGAGPIEYQTTITVWMKDKKLKALVEGVEENIAEVGEQLAWLGSALRPLLIRRSVAFCTPRINVTSSEPPQGYIHQLDLFCEIRFNVEQRATDMEVQEGSCWHSLFQNPVVVKGYPISRRANFAKGLEIPLHIMAYLAQAQRATKFKGKLFAKGFSTMLYPTKRDKDLFVWHLLFNEDGEYISYHDPRIHHLQDHETEDISFSELEKARHVLGWCSVVKNYAGSHDANYDVQPSRCKQPHAGLLLDKFNINGGKLITGGVSFAVADRNSRLRLQSSKFYMRNIGHLKKEFVVMYDVGEKQAWLVNGASALLHLVIASLENDRRNDSHGEYLFQLKNLEKAKDEYTTESAFDILTNRKNMELKVWLDKNDPPEEKLPGVPDDAQGVETAKKSYFRFQDVVEEGYHFLELALESQKEPRTNPGVEIRWRPRNYLEGFDFTELAECKPTIPLRIAGLDETGRFWIDFCRAIEAVALFGRGFGEIISPDKNHLPCSTWKNMPRKGDHLAVCVADLCKIIGTPEKDPIEVVDGLYWHNPDKTFEGCAHIDGAPKCPCDRSQNLLPGRLEFLKSLGLIRIDSPNSWKNQPRGALIFGKSRKLSLRWPEESDKDPEKVPSATSPGGDDRIREASSSGVSGTTQSDMTADSSSHQTSRTDVPSESTGPTSLQPSTSLESPGERSSDLTAQGSTVQQPESFGGKRRKWKNRLRRVVFLKSVKKRED